MRGVGTLPLRFFFLAPAVLGGWGRRRRGMAAGVSYATYCCTPQLCGAATTLALPLLPAAGHVVPFRPPPPLCVVGRQLQYCPSLLPL